MISRILLYFYTLKYLRIGQMFHRLWRARPRMIPPLNDIPSLRAPAASLCEPAPKPISMIGARTFRFLNYEDSLPVSHDWSALGDGLLWRYNLHYFDDLTAVQNAERRDWHFRFITQWIASQTFGSAVSWDAYPTSLRLVNWIKFHHAGTALTHDMQASLAQQAHWLSHNIEWHLCGNHLFVNAKALLVAGCFFEGPIAENWLATGIKILDQELDEQILPDGGHFELSPMYHALITEDILDLIAFTDCYQLPALQHRRTKLVQKVDAMLNWLQIMCHPDGQISFFNDASFGIAPELDALIAYAKRLGLKQTKTADTPLKKLPYSGYYRLDKGPFSLLADMAAIGASYIPGHAHADTLSFELSVCGERVIVNGGVSTYEPGALRLAERSTEAHSTVCIEGQSSSEIWGGFRVARRAHIHDIICEQTAKSISLAAHHDGYTRLVGHPVHHRQWLCTPSTLSIHDNISADRLSAHSRFIFHPQITVRQQGEGKFILNLPNGKYLLMELSQGHIITADYATGFGKRVPTSALIAALSDGNSYAKLTFMEKL